MTTIAANGMHVCVESFGEADAETVLLIAGLGTQMIRWPTAFCQALSARGLRVVRFDNRDAGRSTHLSRSAPPDFRAVAGAVAAGLRPAVPYTLHDMAMDAVGLLDALGVKRAHLVGRSMGGMIAQIVAGIRPDRVASLTSIMSSTANPALPPASPEVMAVLGRPVPDPLLDEAGHVEHGLAVARLLAGPVYPIDERAWRALLREEARRAWNPAGFARQLAAIAATGDLRPMLAGLTVPAFVVHGTRDPLVPAECGRDTARSIPGAQLLMIEGMGHDLPPPLHGMVIDGVERNVRRARHRGR
jgi:pimeloyl-ACP methyl ester carboxylesterase